MQLGDDSDWEAEQSMDELHQLATTAGAKVVDRVVQQREKVHSRTFVGPGKAEEIAGIARAHDATMVVFDDELSPSQQRHVEEEIEIKVLDRTALILDIFAQRAQSLEGKLQVELAQLEYNLPRLRGLWLHLSRLGGGIGTRGPGETQLEVDRRRARQRIGHIKRELSEVAKNRGVQRERRHRANVYTVSLVGYTNAGKSTLLNALTDARALVEDKLFATLDSMSRRLKVRNHQRIVISDTVGFIKKLPHQLVAAFRSTLDEVRDADLLLHVVDASHPRLEEQVKAVESILDEIGAAEKPRLDVLNKMDLIEPVEQDRLQQLFPGAIMISAANDLGLDGLIEEIESRLARNFVKVRLMVPFKNGNVVQHIHATGKVVSEEHRADGTHIEAEIPKAEMARVSRFVEG
ncbi:MAG: GTPase HflX [Actinobacteria bacterium]|nr:GTPase HflX [Actinomycetota bacterium]